MAAGTVESTPEATDTIVAVATPPGRGGIGIVRLAGPRAFALAEQLLLLRTPLEHARARLTGVRDPSASAGVPAAPLDEALATAFRAPRSYTGDDLVEIAAHGSPVVLNAILDAALRAGARLAEPGEFTQRAFLSGRLDLTQAEAVHDLIAAQTLEQARAAAQQLGGALSRRIAPAKEELLHLIALLEAGMDFASGELDDVDIVPSTQIAGAIERTAATLRELVASFHAGALLRSGVRLALVGPPNAGKSSLFNRLLARPRAIVTARPGTTRDTVEELWSLAGIPVHLIDTAGLRLGDEPPADEAEQIGIQRSREALADADLVLLVHDATLPLTQDERALLTDIRGRPHLLVLNKADLLPPAAAAASTASEAGGLIVGAAGTIEEANEASSTAVNVSALQGTGLDHLQHELLRALNAGGGLAQGGALNNRRQQQSVQAALTALDAAQAANTAQLPHELLLIDLHNALQFLDQLTGATTADDILHRIFSTFCIGK